MNKAELMQHMARGGYRIHQQWGLMAPASPPVGEQPEPEQLGPCTSWGPETNPMPLRTDIDTINFAGLIKLADKLDVPHDEGDWFDDEFPDKEDALRIAVAEAMGKVGK